MKTPFAARLNLVIAAIEIEDYNFAQSLLNEVSKDVWETREEGFTTLATKLNNAWMKWPTNTLPNTTTLGAIIQVRDILESKGY